MRAMLDRPSARLNPTSASWPEALGADILNYNNNSGKFFWLAGDEGNFDAVMSLVGCVLGYREYESIAEADAIKRTKHNPLRFLTKWVGMPSA